MLSLERKAVSCKKLLDTIDVQLLGELGKRRPVVEIPFNSKLREAQAQFVLKHPLPKQVREMLDSIFQTRQLLAAAPSLFQVQMWFTAMCSAYDELKGAGYEHAIQDMNLGDPLPPQFERIPENPTRLQAVRGNLNLERAVLEKENMQAIVEKKRLETEENALIEEQARLESAIRHKKLLRDIQERQANRDEFFWQNYRQIQDLCNLIDGEDTPFWGRKRVFSSSRMEETEENIEVTSPASNKHQRLI